MQTITPKEVTKQVRHLAERAAPGQVPKFVANNPKPDALPNECFGNVAAQVEKYGGERILGWTIWEWPNVLIEAEFHAIWKSPEGTLLDITPKADGESEILFVSDLTAIYDGNYIDNKRLALRDDAVIVDFIRMSEELFRLTRIGKPGQAVYLDKSAIVPIAKRVEYLGAMLKVGARDHDPCFCNSGKKYKKCHALTLRH